MPAERLQKLIAQAGLASRRAAERLITGGRVRVNGEVVLELGTKADPQTDKIEVEGHGVIHAEPLVYVAMNKPMFVLCTMDDPGGRQTVIEVMRQSRATQGQQHEGNMPRVYPVGRLDWDAEGLLLLTNDGELAALLTHPRHHVPKTYVVKIKGRPSDKDLERLRHGVRLKEADGTLSRSTAPATVDVVKTSPANTWIELTITEGRNHQVKRMCEAVGRPVLRLIRTAVGGLGVGELEPGQWRFLSSGEVHKLKAWAAGEPVRDKAKRPFFHDERPEPSKKKGVPVLPERDRDPRGGRRASFAKKRGAPRPARGRGNRSPRRAH